MLSHKGDGGKKTFVRIHILLEKNGFCTIVETCTMALFKWCFKKPLRLPSQFSHIKAVSLPQFPEFSSLCQSAAAAASSCSCIQSYQLNSPCFDCFCICFWLNCFLCFDPGVFRISTFGSSPLHQTSQKIYTLLVLQSVLNSSSSNNDTYLGKQRLKVWKVDHLLIHTERQLLFSHLWFGRMH